MKSPPSLSKTLLGYLAAALTGVACLGAQGASAQEEPPTAAVAEGEADGGWEVERFALPTREVREGEMVISISADIDGDGILERLVTTNKQRNGKAGNMWEVFDLVEGRIRRLGDVQFHWDNCGILVEPEFDASPRLYAFDHMKGGTDLVAFSISGGEVVTQTVKTKVDFDEYSKRMKESPPEIRTRSTAEVYGLYTREYVNQFEAPKAESRTSKAGIRNEPAENPPAKTASRPRSHAGSSPAGGPGDNVWYAIALGTPVLLGMAVYLYRSKRR